MKAEETEKRINSGINYRAMTLEIRKAEKDSESESYIVEGYATTFNEPYNMGENESFRILEQVDSKAFDNCDMTDVIFQYDHCGHVFARTSNDTLELAVDEHGLYVRAKLGGTEEGRKLYEEIKGGYTNKMSFGFTITDEAESRSVAADGKDEILYTIKAVGKLYDVSSVSIPANAGTEISARQRFNTEVEKRMAEARENEQKEAELKQEQERAAAKEKELKERERLALELSFTI